MENHINTAITIAEAVQLIYGYDNGDTRRKFKKLVKDNNYDISHLKSRKSILFAFKILANTKIAKIHRSRT